MQYRREVDGLRALAVVPVILFHAGMPAFAGGFVGVDVFFVISGCLITSLILAERDAGTFSLAAFYERRARRILPALFVVLLATWAMAWPSLLAPDMKMFSDSLMAVSGFGSNILFWRTSGYFEPATELKPLLHTWSLAVEEHFYLAFPVLLLLAWRWGKRGMLGIFGGLAAASFALAELGSAVKPAATFYLLPTRAWELLFGSLLAVVLWEQAWSASHRAVREVGGLAGLALLAYAVVAFDGETPFPGAHALLPTLGTALVLLAVSPQTVVGRVLGSKALVGLGLVSYSAYLWHQPLFALARHRSLDAPGPLVMAGLVLATGLLAWGTWRFVEVPCRDRRRFSRREVFAGSALGSLLFAALGAVGHYANGFDTLLSDAQREVVGYGSYAYEQPYREGTCFLRPEQDRRDFDPGCGTVRGAPASLVWGDSHAAELAFGLRTQVLQLAQYTASACPPLLDTDQRSRPHCRAINDFVLGEIGRLKPVRVVLHANWSALHRGGHQAQLEAFAKTLEGVRRVLPIGEILVIGPVPHWTPTLPLLLAKRQVAMDGEHVLPPSGLPELLRIDRGLRAVAERAGASFLSPIEVLCPDGTCPVTVAYRGRLTLTAWDEAHLTEGGSVALAAALFRSRTQTAE